MSIYKTFRRPGISDYVGGAGTPFNTLNARYDQPTYVSFRLVFAPNGDSWYNGAADEVNYDRMPHPLFAPKGIDDVIDRQRYSAVDYLLDANEYTRANMLQEFQQKFNTLQDKFQWYFQKIDGVSDLLKIDPKKGMRVTSDKRLTVTALEAVDLRMSHILNLYRKIAWDDTYQRWVLPDMMRYFTLDIYISEFRTFQGYETKTAESNSDDLSLTVLDNILPTWVIKCEMCEFDLENINFTYLDSLNVGEDVDMAGLTFGIKVGKMYEEQIYPTFQNMYMIDKYLNGFDRARSSIATGGSTTVGTLVDGQPVNVTTQNSTPFNSTTQGTNFNLDPEVYTSLAQELYAQERTHISGAAFNELTNSKNLFGAKAAGPDGKLFTNDDNVANVDPTTPSTWFNNATSFGQSFLKNTVDELIDKAKVTSIPGLGLSFNEAQSALESKNIITALGLVRKAVNEVARGYVQPSELLEGDIQDSMFRSYLEGVATSEATEDNQLIREAANIALNDDGIWGQIKDFSKATDLVGEGELNSPNHILEGTLYKDNIEESTKGDKSLATNVIAEGEGNITKTIQVGQIIEAAPSSKATNSKILKG